MAAMFVRYEDATELRAWTTSELIAELANYVIESRLNSLDYHEQIKRSEIAEEIDRRLPHAIGEDKSDDARR